MRPRFPALIILMGIACLYPTQRYIDSTRAPRTITEESLYFTSGRKIKAMSLGMSSLVTGWRDKAGAIPVKAEAKRRIERDFSVADQLNILHELVDAILKHGADMSKWPADVRQRKMAHDEGRKYIADVRERARTQTIVPRDPASDKLWPQRLKKF